MSKGNVLSEKELQHLVELSKVKGSVYQLPKKLQDLILPEESREKVLKEVENKYGKKERNRVESWVKNYKYELPKILGDNFSYNLLSSVFAVFIRYFLNLILKDEEARKKFESILKTFYIDKDIEQKNIKGWLRRDVSFSQRFISFSEEYRKAKSLNNLFLAYFYYKILHTPIVEQGKETKKQIEFSKNVLEAQRFKEDEQLKKEMEQLISNFIHWLIDNVPVVPYPDRENIQSLKVVRRKESILSTLLVRYNWVTRKIAEMFSIDKDQSDEVLFPQLHKFLMKTNKELIEKIEEKAEKDFEKKQKK